MLKVQKPDIFPYRGTASISDKTHAKVIIRGIGITISKLFAPLKI